MIKNINKKLYIYDKKNININIWKYDIIHKSWELGAPSYSTLIIPKSKKFYTYIYIYIFKKI